MVVSWNCHGLHLVDVVNCRNVYRQCRWPNRVDVDGYRRPTIYFAKTTTMLLTVPIICIFFYHSMSASFYASPLIGATTTLACFAHEIPHEIADYSILIRAGFSKRDAMRSQFMTAVGAFVSGGSLFLFLVHYSFSFLFSCFRVILEAVFLAIYCLVPAIPRWDKPPMGL